MFDNHDEPPYDPDEHTASTNQIKCAWWVAVATVLIGLAVLELI